LVSKPAFQQFKENGFAVLRLFSCYVWSKLAANGSSAFPSCLTHNTKLKSCIAFSTAESLSYFEAESWPKATQTSMRSNVMVSQVGLPSQFISYRCAASLNVIFTK
jgi:hypothetical protein